MEKNAMKRRSILDKFSTFRDSSSGKLRKEKEKARPLLRGSTMTLPAFHDDRSKERLYSPQDEAIKADHDDTVNEIASDLLEDTTVEQCKDRSERAEVCRPISFGLNEAVNDAYTTIEDAGGKAREDRAYRRGEPIKFVMPSGRDSPLESRGIGFTHNNFGISTPLRIDGPNDVMMELPQLPLNIFNDEDPWTMSNSPVVTSASHLNPMRFSVDELSAPTGSIPKNTSSHSRKSSAPAIPRRSSKRKSGRSKSNITSPQKPTKGHVRSSASKNKLSKSFSTPLIMNVSAPVNQLHSSATSSSINPEDIQGKIAKMLEATQALKGSSSESALHQGHSVSSKRRRLKDNNVLSKVKTAINDRMTSRNSRRAHDPDGDDRFLNASTDDSPDIDASRPLLEPLEEIIEAKHLRLAEGKNFKKSKIHYITGSGNIRRKPVAKPEDGNPYKSPLSHDKDDDPFCDQTSSSSQRRTPSSLEHKLMEDTSSEETSGVIPSLPKLPRSLSTLPTFRKLMPSTLSHESDSDDVFSSSPVDQSTPRMRLEPSFENGKKTLKSVPATSQSLFDSDSSIGSPNTRMDIDSEPIVEVTETDAFTHETVPQHNLRRVSRLGYRETSKTYKKHPSPSKSELESLEQKVTEKLRDLNKSDRRDTVKSTHLLPSCVLTPRDPNTSIADRDSKHSDKSEMTRKFEESRIHSSMPNMVRNSKQRYSLSSITCSSRRGSRQSDVQCKSGIDMENHSDMEIDELQMNDSVYNIGGIRTSCS